MRNSGFKRSNLNRLGGMLNNQLSDLGLRKKITEHQAVANWSDVVGPQIADKSIAQSVRDGVIFVCCKNSMWANELTFHKEDIIKRLNKSVGQKVITDLRFSSKGFKIEEKDQKKLDTKINDKELKKVKLDENKIEFIEKTSENLESKDLKDIIEKAMLTGLRMAELKKIENETK